MNFRISAISSLCVVAFFLFTLMSCNNNPEETKSSKDIHLITLDPGHFHAALVQKSMYDMVDSTVKVYAPDGSDVELHLERIQAFNSRSENPTHWKEDVYTGNDFFEKMLAENKNDGDNHEGSKVVVLAGNNQKKTDYILESLQSGFNVLGDKPMAINSAGFNQLKEAFDVASKNNLLLYDIMTERFEITSILLRELSMMPEIFGTLTQGTQEDPSVVKHAVHFLYKYVSGNVLTRPAWFFDIAQEGEGIVDVLTHLVDLAQIECFPGQSLDYTKDIMINDARRWTTDLGLSEFKAITKTDSFPKYLKAHVSNDTSLKLYCNGEIEYSLKGVHVKTSVVWNYKAAEDVADSYEALMKGTKANLLIKHGAQQNNKSTLYIQPAEINSLNETTLIENFKPLAIKYPGVELKKSGNGWEVFIPEKYREGHEAHFARVTENFLEYLQNKNMPAWEVPGMLTKYYTTTKALEIANKKK